MTLILFFIFAILIFGIMLVLSVARGISSFIGGKPSYSTNRDSSSQKQQQYTSKTQKKIFSRDEGEYISYEEIKE